MKTRKQDIKSDMETSHMKTFASYYEQKDFVEIKLKISEILRCYR